MVERNARFHPQAEEEVQRAYTWYRERNPTAARAFLADLDHAVLRVTEAPERWPLYPAEHDAISSSGRTFLLEYAPGTRLRSSNRSSTWR
jgi:plasmid stabilization system protein ParE